MKKIITLTPDLKATLTDDKDDEIRSLVHKQIKAFNDGISEHHRAVRKSGIQALHILVHDSNGNLVGGLIADTYWGWLDIDDFWLEKSHRRQGLGTVLLETAEKEAKARNCQHAQLKTFSFQARGFYEKCGYRVAGELNDYPPGHAFYWMCKELK